MTNAKKPLSNPDRLKREADALRENLAKRKQQQRRRQTTNEAPAKKETSHARHA
jgi:hypothetical protein